MNWKKWKIGLVIATLTSLFVAGSTALVGGNWRVFLAAFCAALITNWGAYLKQHPIENIEDTQFLLQKKIIQNTKEKDQ